jgi:hypothetical protein
MGSILEKGRYEEPCKSGYPSSTSTLSNSSARPNIRVGSAVDDIQRERERFDESGEVVREKEI